MNYPRRLIDTNVYAAFRRGESSVLDAIHQSQRLCLSSVVIGELLFGFRMGNRLEENLRHLHTFMESPYVQCLPVTETTANHYSRLAESLRRKGTPIPTNDIWIAAHAIEFDAQLLTYDQHFEHVEGINVLRLTAAR